MKIVFEIKALKYRQPKDAPPAHDVPKYFFTTTLDLRPTLVIKTPTGTDPELMAGTVTNNATFVTDSVQQHVFNKF